MCSLCSVVGELKRPPHPNCLEKKHCQAPSRSFSTRAKESMPLAQNVAFGGPPSRPRRSLGSVVV